MTSAAVRVLIMAGVVLTPAGQTLLLGQEKPASPAPAAQAKPAPAPADQQAPVYLKKQYYVPRISFGGTLQVLIFEPLKPGSATQDTTAPPVLLDSATTPQGHRVGGGAVVQVAVTDRFAVAAGVVMQRSTHQTVNEAVLGLDNPSTTREERNFTTDTSTTKARYFDVSLLVRRYSKDRSAKGPRWFFEGGATVRHVTRIRTSTEQVLNGETTCCNLTPLAPAHKNARGATAGFGAQFVDDFGIKLIPEVRYTRWMDRTWDTLSTKSRRDQIEAMISLTF